MTNFDRIKAMSVEEMAVALMCPAEFDKTFNKYKECIPKRCCNKCVKEWLESEVDT